MTTTGYAHPEMLVDTEWLASHLNDANMVIVDCDLPDAYNRAHIPGAVNLGENHYIKGDGSVHVMAPEEASEFLGNLGIGDETLVVAYSGRHSIYAARLWWVLSYYGHMNVKVLNGGWRKWLAEGRSMSDRPSAPEPRRFTPKVDPSLIVKADELKSAIGEEGTVIWDTRAADEYSGENSRGNKYSGHIPGAPHLEWSDVMDVESGEFRPAEEIRSMLSEKGVTPEQQVYTY